MMEADEIEKLIRGLDSWCWQERRRCVAALGRSGDARAAAALCRALQDGTLHGAAAQALLLLGEAATPALCMTVRRANHTVRCRAAGLLGRIGDPRAIPTLEAALLNPSDAGLRQQAAAALAAIGDPRQARDLEALLQHPDGGVRRRAAMVLTGLRHPSAVPVLETLLQHADEEICRCAAAALGEIGDLRTFRLLCQVVPNGSAEAAWALAEIADRRPLPAADLQAALSALEQRVATPFVAVDSILGTEIVRTSLHRVQAKAASTRNLPIPAAALSSAQSLPRPAAAPVPSVAGLPAPARETEVGNAPS